MIVTKKDVEYVAQLSKLNFEEKEMEKLTGQLNGILEYVNQLNEIDTEGVAMTAHAVPMHNVFREDIAIESMDIEKVLQNAPDRYRNCFKVPKIVE